MDVINTHTGKLFVDRVRKLEFVSVGDYGQEENVKADFLGLKQEIHGVKHHAVDLTQKWITLISTQKGHISTRPGRKHFMLLCARTISVRKS